MAKSLLALGILTCVLLFSPKVTFAILPPDLIVSVGSQFVQIITIVGFLSAAIFSTFLLFYQQCIRLIIRFRYSILIVLPCILMALGAQYAIHKIETQADIATQKILAADEKIKNLQQAVRNSQSVNELQEYISTCEQNSATSTTITQKHCAPGHIFISDTITVFGNTPAGPIVFEIDANRLEKVPGVYSQYFFLNAIIDGVDHADYNQQLATTSLIQTGGFLLDFEKISASDQSTRASYQVVVEVSGKTYTIEIATVEGDFITRDTPDYTRIQSTAKATISVDGMSYNANAFVESVYSDDYTKKIFFPGRDNQKVKTSQFVLWDTLGNFYLFDDTKTDSYLPQYAPHTWLLYKEAESNFLKKGFAGSFKQTVALLGSRQWTVNFNEFNGAQVSLTELSTFKETGGRSRFLVSGTVADTKGTRNINGIVHVIE